MHVEEDCDYVPVFDICRKVIFIVEIVDFLTFFINSPTLFCICESLAGVYFVCKSWYSYYEFFADVVDDDFSGVFVAFCEGELAFYSL